MSLRFELPEGDVGTRMDVELLTCMIPNHVASTRLNVNVACVPPLTGVCRLLILSKACLESRGTSTSRPRLDLSSLSCL